MDYIPEHSDYAEDGDSSEAPELRHLNRGAWINSLGYTGGIIRDVSGYKNHLTAVGAFQSMVQGRRCYGHNGSTNYCVGPTLVVTYPITISVLVKLAALPISGTEQVVITLAKTSGLEEFWFAHANVGGVQYLRVVAQSDGGANTLVSLYSPTIDTNWHHIVVQFVTTTSRLLYYDGVLLSGADTPGGTGTPSPAGIDTTYLGGLYYNTSNFYSPFSGYIGDAQVWPRILSHSDALQLTFDPMAMWRLREEELVAGVAATDTIPIINGGLTNRGLICRSRLVA